MVSASRETFLLAFIITDIFVLGNQNNSSFFILYFYAFNDEYLFNKNLNPYSSIKIGHTNSFLCSSSHNPYSAELTFHSDTFGITVPCMNFPLGFNIKGVQS